MGQTYNTKGAEESNKKHTECQWSATEQYVNQIQQCNTKPEENGVDVGRPAWTIAL